MRKIILPLLLITALTCENTFAYNKAVNNYIYSYSLNDTLPAPFATRSSHNYSKVIGWHNGKTPLAPEGFTVTKFADKLNNPRLVYVANNGDIFVSEANTFRPTVLKIYVSDF